MTRNPASEEKTRYVTSSREQGKIKLVHIEGDCLEAVGVPPRGCRAAINRTIVPVVGDLVWCRRDGGSLTSYIKRVKSYEDGRLIVGTAYADAARDVEFFAAELYGVVEYVFDGDGDLAYCRDVYFGTVRADVAPKEEKE